MSGSGRSGAVPSGTAECCQVVAEQSRQDRARGHGRGRSTRGTPLLDRLARLTRKTDCCWIWLGGTDGGGYGLIRIDGRLQKAHRVSYELHVGPIPDGLYIDHLCRVRLCLRPDHLEPVTNGQNTARGIGPSGDAAKAARTHCPQGHPYDDIHIDRGARFCRRCKNDYSNRGYARRRQAAKESA